ncbi:antibiotic ABC transporter permease [Halomicroarcula sp. GCM10025709]|uniref:antibiotic ABC transporter permease n=1 Tax=Haloarcula TaxID=2237 RepID=UPI0024C3EE81|nr:antibiotic ABC transporter permease [Halomicroarcula sp. YJ-61-S]
MTTEQTGPVDLSTTRAPTLLRETLAYARERDYTGWDYADGLSSKLLRAVPVDNKWVNIAVQESIKRAPVNVRPLFLVEQRRNYMGAALFAMANLTYARLLTAGAVDEPAEASVDHVGEARSLVDWLIEHRSVGYSGFCGGHKHEIQTLRVKGLPNHPSVVSTAFPVRALLAAAPLDPSYAEVARTAADFVVDDLNYRAVDGGAVIDYHVQDTDEYYTINAGALGARLLVDLYDVFDESALRERARRIFDHVADLQTDRGGWYYREPPDASHLSMDNFHNGFIIESLQRYGDVVDERYADVVEDGVEFYRNELFEASGAPNWDESCSYPRDIHASAQGILVFTYAGRLDFARRILEWTLDNLYGGDGRFYHRKHRYHTKRTTLMRWCQAWMVYAISEFLRVDRGIEPQTTTSPVCSQPLRPDQRGEPR